MTKYNWQSLKLGFQKCSPFSKFGARKIIQEHELKFWFGSKETHSNKLLSCMFILDVTPLYFLPGLCLDIWDIFVGFPQALCRKKFWRTRAPVLKMYLGESVMGGRERKKVRYFTEENKLQLLFLRFGSLLFWFHIPNTYMSFAHSNSFIFYASKGQHILWMQLITFSVN